MMPLTTYVVKRASIAGKEREVLVIDDSDDEEPPAKVQRSCVDDDDEVMVVAPPVLPVAPVAPGAGSDVAVTGVRSAMVLPHSREDCTTYRFSAQSSFATAKQFCPQCYCFVCDVQVLSCSNWSSHCRAHKNSTSWVKERKRVRASKRRASEAPQRSAAAIPSRRTAHSLGGLDAPARTSSSSSSMQPARTSSSSSSSMPRPVVPVPRTSAQIIQEELSVSHALAAAKAARDVAARTSSVSSSKPRSTSSLSSTPCLCEKCTTFANWFDKQVDRREVVFYGQGADSCIYITAKAKPNLDVVATFQDTTLRVNSPVIRIRHKSRSGMECLQVFETRVPSPFLWTRRCATCGFGASICSTCVVCGMCTCTDDKMLRRAREFRLRPPGVATCIGTTQASVRVTSTHPRHSNKYSAAWKEHPEWQASRDDLVRATRAEALSLVTHTDAISIDRRLLIAQDWCTVTLGLGKHSRAKKVRSGMVMVDEKIEGNSKLQALQKTCSETMSMLGVDIDVIEDDAESTGKVFTGRLTATFHVFLRSASFKAPPASRKASLGGRSRSLYKVLSLFGAVPEVPTKPRWEAPASALSDDYEIRPSGDESLGGWASTEVSAEALQTSIRAEFALNAGPSYSTINSLLKSIENRGHAEARASSLDGLAVELLPYQRQAVQWMLDQEHLEGGVNSHLFAPVTVAGTEYDLSPFLNYLRPRTDGPLSASRGGILATEMGMGKTLVSVGAILANPAPTLGEENNMSASDARAGPWGPGRFGEAQGQLKLARGTLVVCPVSLVGQWVREVEEKITNDNALRIYKYYGPGRTTNVDVLKDYDVVVTTYAILASDFSGNNPGARASHKDFKLPPLGRLCWWRIILDESHTIKQANTVQSRACAALVAHRRWCVTGTPMNTAVADLAPQLRFLGVELLGDPTLFNTLWNSQRTGLVAFLRRVLLRHSKSMLFVDKRGAPPPPPRKLLALPPRIDEKVDIDMTPAERQAYDALEARARAAVAIVGGWHHTRRQSATFLLHSIIRPLRQACSGGVIASSVPTPVLEHQSSMGVSVDDADASAVLTASSGVVMQSKLRTLVAKLRAIRESDPTAKSLVFSQFPSTLDFLKEEMPKHDFQYRTLRGDMSMQQRTKALRDFQDDPPTTVFLLSVRAASCGCNLTQANHVFLLEPCLNTALAAQAIGRVHRMGQKRQVHIHSLIMRNTLEARVHTLLYSSDSSDSSGSQSRPPLLDSDPNAPQPEHHQAPAAKGTDCLAGSIRNDNAKLNYDKFAALVGI